MEIGAALARSLRLLSWQLKEKRIVVDVRGEDGLRVWAEEVPFVNSVLNNLLTNAVKFSHPGGRIEIRAESDPQWVRLSIRDRGIGIPPALLERLRGTQKVASRSGTLGEPGAGFGLRLARKFVESYGGSLEMRSVEKGGGGEAPGTEVTLALRNAAP